MSRIPDEEIPRLKKEIPLAELCRERGVELQPHGKDLIGRCPFHDDKTPSFVVTPSKNLWNCLGACGVGGSNIDFIMRMEKADFRGAVAILQRRRGSAPAVTLKTRLGTERVILADPAQEHSDAALLGRVADFYHETFLNHPQAMQYLQQRGCFHPEAVTKFRLGFANRMLGYRIPMTTVDGKRLKERLEKLGVFRPSKDGKGGHEHLRGCVVFPVFDGEGQVVGMYGRRCGTVMPGAPKHLYLPGPHVGVWNAQEMQRSRVWLLCEAAVDALSLWCHGFPNVTWSYGVHGFSPDHWQLLRSVRPERVIICYDNDEAGTKAANELAQKLEPEGVEAWRVELKPQSDINDVARGPAFNRPRDYDPKNEFAALLAGAVRLLPSGEGRKFSIPVAVPLVAEAEAAKEKKVEPALSPETKDESRPAEAPFSFSCDGREATLQAGERLWRVRGLDANTSFDAMKVNLRMQYRNKFHLHTFDLYNARARGEFTSQTVEVTGATKADLESDLAALITQLEEQHQSRLIQRMAVAAKPTMPAISPEEEAEALAILKNPRLLDVIIQDLQRCGMVGEETNLAVAWLVSLSRKLEKPLGVCVMSRSAAGKSTLLESISWMVPEEDKHQYTALTPQALFHMPEDELRHKALFLAEDVGAESASYSLKTIQSDGQLIIACTVKDEASGQLMTKTKIVHGPVALFLTSTSRSVDDELLNRLFVLTIDESAEQTGRIHESQRHEHTLQGIIERRARPRLRRLHQNLQRLIRPLIVQNPFRDQLIYQSRTLRSRRDHRKYLDLINVIALAHQHQRAVKSAQDIDGAPFQYIEVTREDIARADALLSEVLPQTTDELWPASRRMLQTLRQWANELPLKNGTSHTWTRRDIRERTGWSDTQVRMVLSQLVEFEYLAQIGHGGRGNLVLYRIVEDGLRPKFAEFAVSSQSQKSELSARASSLLAATLAAPKASSQSSQGVHVENIIADEIVVVGRC